MRWLPLDYPIRNLRRRPVQTLLTGLASCLVAGVLVATVSFVSGLEQSFADQGKKDTAILLSTAAMRDLVRSAISPAVADLVAGDVKAVRVINGTPAVSPEIHMGTNLRLGGEPAEGAADPVYAAFVRGVTARAFLVHDDVTLLDGRLPGPGEVLVGRLVAAKIGVPEQRLRTGAKLRFEGGEFVISGTFAAPGTTTESEIWAPLKELMGHARRDDISAVFVRVTDPDAVADVEVFAQRRLDLELVCIPSTVYYSELVAYFEPIRGLAWAMAVMIALTVVFTGANTLNTVVQDRINELATLLALGYSGAALVASLLVEALLLSAAGGLVGLIAAGWLVSESTFRIGMGAFALRVGGASVLIGFAGVLLLGLLGTLPAGTRVLRIPVATALKED